MLNIKLIEHEAIAKRFDKFFYLPQEVGDKDDNLHPRPKGGEVHRMMISQTGDGKP